MYWRGPRNRDAEGVEGEGMWMECPLGGPPPLSPQLTRWSVESLKLPQRAEPGRKRILMHLELERTHLIATNLTFFLFLRHIFSHIPIHNYET